MKNLKTLLIILVAFSSFMVNAQSPFPSGIRLKNATEVTTADSIPVMGAKGIIRNYIKVSNLGIGGGTIAQDNQFLKKTVGNYQYGDTATFLALVNNLPAYTVDEIQTVIFETISQQGEFERQETWFTILKGKGTYGVGGTQLLLSDLYLVNPTQEETERNTTYINNITSNENRILYGSVTWTGTGLNFESTEIGYLIDGDLYKAPPTQFTLSPSDPALDRFDTFAVTTSNTITVIEGTPSNDPQEPTIGFGTQLRVTSVLIQALATTPTALTDETVYDEFLGEPTEWTLTENTGDTKIKLNSTVLPSSGAKHINVNLPLLANQIAAVNDVLIPNGTFSQLTFRLKLNNLWGGKSRIEIALNDATGRVGFVSIKLSDYGIIANDFTNYQLLVIPKAKFNLGGDFNRMTFNFRNLTTNSFYIDRIRIVGGIENPPTALINQDNKKNIIQLFTNTSATIDKAFALNLINNLPQFTIDEIHNFAFIINVGQRGEYPTKYIYETHELGKGIYGLGGTQILENNIELYSTVGGGLIDITNDPSTQFIQLGNAGTSGIVSAFNSHTFTGLENPVQGQDEGYVLIDVIINNTPLQYLFTGIGGSYGVGGTSTAILTDFVLLTDIAGDASTQFIEAGEQGTDVNGDINPIENVFNALSPCNTVQAQIDGYVIVNATIEGIPTQYLFVGTGGSYGSGCTDIAVAEDFVILEPIIKPSPENQTWNKANQWFGQLNPPEISILNTGNIIHNGIIVGTGLRLPVNLQTTTAGINSIGYGVLPIGANYGIDFTTGNANHGNFIFKQGTVSYITSNTEDNNVISRRNFNGAFVASNYKVSGFKTEDTVNLTSLTNSNYAAFKASPIITGIGATNKVYSLLSENVLVDIFSAGDTYLPKIKSPTGLIYMTTIDDVGKLGSQVVPSGGGTADNWGSQVAVTNATLTGNGTAASPLAVVAGPGDNWGTQVAITNSTLSGNGTAASPLTRTGLEEVNEGNGIGWRLIGRNPTQYGNIGLNALDFGNNTTASTVFGATGQTSFNQGENNIVSGYGATSFGFENNVSGAASYAFGSFLTVGQTYSFNFGYQNSINVASNRGYNFLSGRGNTIIGGLGIQMLGTGLTQTQGIGVVVLGHANEAITATNATNNDSNPVLIVGNGNHTALPEGDWSAATLRRNALVVRHSGAIQFPTGYGAGTRTGTPTYGLSVDATGNVIETALGGGGSGTTETASNGLTKFTNDIQLGGSLTKDTNINGIGFGIGITSNKAGAGLSVINSDTVNGLSHGIYGEGVVGVQGEGNSYGLYGNSNVNTGVLGIGANTGVAGSSSSGVALYGSSDFGSGLQISIQGTDNTGVPVYLSNSESNTKTNFIEFLKTGKSVGFTRESMGANILTILASETYNTAVKASSLNNYWESGFTHATRVSGFDIQLVNSSITPQTVFKLLGTGKARLNKYGINTFTGTPTYNLAVDATGNIIETALGGGGGGSGTVTSVSALTLGTTGTDLNSSVANPTTTPVITLNVPTASATNRGALSSANWTTFNNKQNAISLTTTGTSGASTFNGTTLNIPNYAGGGGGDVYKVGTPFNGQMGLWTGDGTIKGSPYMRYDDALYGKLILGSDKIENNSNSGDRFGWLVLNGGFSGNAIIDMFVNDESDAIVEKWRIIAGDGTGSGSNFTISSTNGIPGAFVIDSATLAMTAPSTTNADIVTLGAKALITKEYGDANYVGGGGGGDMLLGTAQTVTALKTFNTGTLAVRNPANTFSYSILGSAITAARTVTMPLLTANDVFTFNAATQTLTNKTVNGVTLSTAQGTTNFLRGDGTYAVPSGGGSGTVTSASVVGANGFAGTVATATTTPAITISTTVNGLLKGNGTAISAAVAGTDYVVPSALTSLLPVQTTNTGSVVSLTTSGGNLCNFGSVNATTAYTTTGTVLNAYSKVFINTATQPTVNGASSYTVVNDTKLIGGSAWVANTDMYLVINYTGAARGIEFYFLSIIP